MGLKVAIVGMSPSCKDAPWDDPTWEKWGLPWHDGYWRKMDRLFEMHDLLLLDSEHSQRKPGYLNEILQSGVPLYMQEKYWDEVTAYPFDEVAKSTRRYWNSSIAYAMALAIHEGAEEIAVYGVDMKGDDEYGYQKPNMEYFCGFAEGRGIKLTVHEDSPLLKFNAVGVKFYDHTPVYVDRYGWLG